MTILLTNDDGIHADGLAALEEACEKLGELVVVAPAEAHSGCGHRTTTSRPLSVTREGQHRLAVDGTPADCVRLGVLHLAGEVDFVLAGINEGGNLGVDLYMSGTAAAAREAALMGKPAVAVSHYRAADREFDWPRAIRLTRRVLDDLPRDPPAEPGFWNVNLPQGVEGIPHPPIVYCAPDHHPLPVRFQLRESVYHYQSDYHGRPRAPQSDVDVCFSGRIAVSFVALRAS